MSDVSIAASLVTNDSCPFACFGLSPTLMIDQASLQSVYYQLQQAVHPDRFAGRTVYEQAAAAQQSSRINKAYECLNHPIDRLWAYLKALNIQADRHDNVADHPELISRVFELQEARAELSSDQAQQQFLTELQQQFNQGQQDFQQMIDQQHSADQLIGQLHWLTYLYKLIKEINSALNLKVNA